jgi:hypothetical protein
MALGNQLVKLVANPFYGIITSGPEAAANIAQHAAADSGGPEDSLLKLLANS